MAMGFRFKKIIAAALLTFTFITVTEAVVAPRRAQAIVGIATLNVPFAVIGGVLLATGGVWGVCATGACGTPDNFGATLGLFLGIAAGPAMGLIGLIMLPADGSPVQLRAINPELAASLHLTPQQRNAFSEELPEINQLLRIVHQKIIESKILASAQPTQVDKDRALALSRQLISEGIQSLSIDARKAMESYSEYVYSTATKSYSNVQN